MGTAHKFPGLYLRGNTYYYRARVPSELVDAFGKPEVKTSLKTGDRQVALERAKKAAHEAEALFADLRRQRPVLNATLPPLRTSLTPEEAAYVAQSTVHHYLSEDDKVRKCGMSGDAMDVYLSDIQDLEEEVARGLAEGKFPGALMRILDKRLLALNVKLNRESDMYADLGYEFMVALREAVTNIRLRFRYDLGKFPRTPAALPVPASLTIAGAGEASRGMTLYEVLDRWAKETKPVARTVDEHRGFVDAFLACIGGDKSTPVASLSRDDMVKYKGALVDAELASRTVGKRLSAIRGLMSFALANGHGVALNDRATCERLEAALKVTITQSKKGKEKSRVPFATDDLQKLFRSPVWSEGLRPEGGKGEAAWWLPVLALATGCRREELASLRVDQVRRDAGGVVYIDLSNAETKTVSSQRKVPLHSIVLNDLDFVAYLESVKGQEYLFPGLGADEYGKMGEAWGKWFGRYLRGPAGIKDEKKVFHSFRHTFKDLAREAGISKEVHDKLTGHAPSDVGGQYGHGVSLRALDEALQTVDLNILKIAGKWRAVGG